MKKTLKLIFLFLLFIKISDSQVADATSHRHYPSIMLGIGGIKFTGDAGSNTNINAMHDTRLGYYLKGEYRFGKHLGIMAGGLYGKFAGNDNSASFHYNFESKAIQFDASFVTYFDHFFKQNDEVAPYLSLGIGYLFFDAFGDMKNATSSYNYWSDGSIYDLPETIVNQNFSTLIKRDYVYETQLTDPTVNYKRTAITIPVGTGFDFRIGPRWDVQVGLNYNFILSDYVDNVKSGKNDAYLMGHTGIKYTFVPQEKLMEGAVKFDEIDRLDVDEDGVGDDIDRCLSTPKGIVVDHHGCPPDSDHDGIPNYLDKELKTRRGSTVDNNGVAINIDTLALHQLMWDSIAAEENNTNLLNNPSTAAVKKTENAVTNNEKLEHAKIPDKFKYADTNKDGHISVKEINETIDNFFNETTNIDIEGIDNLIEYFFEQ